MGSNFSRESLDSLSFPISIFKTPLNFFFTQGWFSDSLRKSIIESLYYVGWCRFSTIIGKYSLKICRRYESSVTVFPPHTRFIIFSFKRFNQINKVWFFFGKGYCQFQTIGKIIPSFLQNLTQSFCYFKLAVPFSTV